MASAAAALVLDVMDAVVAHDGDGPVGDGSARADGGSSGLGNTYPAEEFRGFRKQSAAAAEQVVVAAACHKRRGARTGEGDPSAVVDLAYVEPQSADADAEEEVGEDSRHA